MKVDEQGHEEKDVRRLREFATFDKLSDNDLQRIVSAAHHTSTSAPLPLIHEQTPSDACYILLTGEAGVYVGQDRVAVVGPGEVIGESALRRGKLRSATVTTTGPAEVLRIERDDLGRLLEAIPALRETMDATAARHAATAAPEQPPKPKPTHRRVDAQVPTELVERFEQAAEGAGVRVSAALEDALTQWIERNSTA
ncbi:cyclic nucleotide-binding domain-containing protein [Mycobacterium sp. 1245805.9]|uniref:cyclic nucleotide-binding domain-containing protein n=1 Tax=Mycobacterium sp. 1245805.9 TaxID=1856862 RepID=UPI00080074C3|nr:cyclic nucleotide-binding domain-containing protein [Mycobacterium sp. 1245805.9]OBI94201.1 cAMP-binding protein [Mycobacterium sp. 1245805.9]